MSNLLHVYWFPLIIFWLMFKYLSIWSIIDVCMSWWMLSISLWCSCIQSPCDEVAREGLPWTLRNFTVNTEELSLLLVNLTTTLTERRSILQHPWNTNVSKHGRRHWSHHCCRDCHWSCHRSPDGNVGIHGSSCIGNFLRKPTCP